MQQFSVNLTNLKTNLHRSMLKPAIYKEMLFSLRKLKINVSFCALGFIIESRGG